MAENTSIIQEPASTAHLDRAQFEGEPEFLVEIIGLFLDTYPELRASIEESAARKDASKLRIAAHMLKGSLAFGAETVV